MTTLDRAFVKAFTNQEQGGQAESTVRTVPLSQALDALSGRKPEPRPQPKPSDKPMATTQTTTTRDQTVVPPSAGPTRESIQEVDHFHWPAICTRIAEVAGNELEQVAETIAQLNSPPGRVVAVGGCRRGEGATTLLLCTAARLAQRNLKVLVVDADLDEAQLSRRLGLVAEHGWEEVLAGRLALADVIVQSSTEHVAVLPLRDPTAYSLATLERLAEHLDTVRSAYDVVLVNVGPWDDARTTGHLLAHGIGRRLDLFILVHDVRLTTESHRDEICAELSVAGVTQVAVAENFAQAS